MGCWDIFCPICGLPLGYNILDSIKQNGYVSYIKSIKYNTWSNKCTIRPHALYSLRGATRLCGRQGCGRPGYSDFSTYTAYKKDQLARSAPP